jgi:hypothetical protein
MSCCAPSVSGRKRTKNSTKCKVKTKANQFPDSLFCCGYGGEGLDNCGKKVKKANFAQETGVIAAAGGGAAAVEGKRLRPPMLLPKTDFRRQTSVTAAERGWAAANAGKRRHSATTPRVCCAWGWLCCKDTWILRSKRKSAEC